MFDKEISQVIAQSEIGADEEKDSKDQMRAENVYSIEYYHDLIRRVKDLEN